MGILLSKNQANTSKIEDALVAEIKSNVIHTITDISIDEETESAEPPIAQTPLTKTIATHLNRIVQNNLNTSVSTSTPSNLMRKKILSDLGYSIGRSNYIDPRSPSTRIPRTPLDLSKNDDKNDGSLDNQNCQSLNDITLDNMAETSFNTAADGEILDEKNSIEKREMITTENETNVQNVLVMEEKESDVNIEIKKAVAAQNPSTDDEIDTMAQSTPIKPHRVCSGRIPLSVLNRHGTVVDRTPVLIKINNDDLMDAEKIHTPAQYNENNPNVLRPKSASKIPVFLKK